MLITGGKVNLRRTWRKIVRHYIYISFVSFKTSCFNIKKQMSDCESFMASYTHVFKKYQSKPLLEFIRLDLSFDLDFVSKNMKTKEIFHSKNTIWRFWSVSFALDPLESLNREKVIKICDESNAKGLSFVVKYHSGLMYTYLLTEVLDYLH